MPCYLDCIKIKEMCITSNQVDLFKDNAKIRSFNLLYYILFFKFKFIGMKYDASEITSNK